MILPFVVVVLVHFLGCSIVLDMSRDVTVPTAAVLDALVAGKSFVASLVPTMRNA